MSRRISSTGSGIHARSSEGLSGFELLPATVRFRDGVLSREYKRLLVTGWGGAARPESGVRLIHACPGCLHKEYSGLRDAGRLIDPEQWNGEDFFVVWPVPTYIFVTHRVVEFLEAPGVRSYYAHPLNERTPICDSTSATFSIGSLSRYLPADLAVRYGQALGLV
jgi:hypothetical protein